MRPRRSRRPSRPSSFPPPCERPPPSRSASSSRFAHPRNPIATPGESCAPASAPSHFRASAPCSAAQSRTYRSNGSATSMSFFREAGMRRSDSAEAQSAEASKCSLARSAGDGCEAGRGGPGATVVSDEDLVMSLRIARDCADASVSLSKELWVRSRLRQKRRVRMRHTLITLKLPLCSARADGRVRVASLKSALRSR
jgi:hypothetical protein